MRRRCSGRPTTPTSPTTSSRRAARRWEACCRHGPAPRSHWPAFSKRAAISACWSTRSSSAACATTFFGRPCETSPLVPKLARQFECDVYPARCKRLPGNRYRLELEEKLDAAARRRRQDRRRRHRAAAERRRRTLDPRGSRPVDVVPQALEADAAAPSRPPRRPTSRHNSSSPRALLARRTASARR